MKPRAIIWLAVILTATMFGFASKTAGVAVNDVYAVTLSMQVNYQDDLNGIPVIGRVQVINKHLINLALGHPPTNAVPRNQVLAVTYECGSQNPRLVVFDKSTSNVLVTVASVAESTTAVARRRGVFGLLLEVANTNRLAGGLLVATGSTTFNTNFFTPKCGCWRLSASTCSRTAAGSFSTPAGGPGR